MHVAIATVECLFYRVPSVRQLLRDAPALACFLYDKPVLLRDTIKGTLYWYSGALQRTYILVTLGSK
jgi:hypothetical protein